MLQLVAGDVAGLGGGAIDLLEVIGLALVDALEDEVWLLIAHALDDGGEIGGAVHG